MTIILIPLFGIALCTTTLGNRYWKRYTTTCIDETGEFVINIPHAGMKQAWQVCGSISLARQPEADKFALANLTPAPAAKVKAPLIAECPVNIECKLLSVTRFGDHDLFAGQALIHHVSRELLDKNGKIDPAKFSTVVLAGGHFFDVGKHLRAWH